MNGSIYLFGELSSGYTQYPDDGSSDVFKTFYRNSKAITQIAIHRDRNLMYYGYIRKLHSHKYIGICLVLHGVMIKDINTLFEVYEKTISDFVNKGDLIHLSKNGEIVAGVSELHRHEESIKFAIHKLSEDIENIETYQLPITDYSVSRDSSKDFSFNDKAEDIVKASHTFGFTYIYKDEDYDTIQTNSSRAVIKQINKENEAYKKRINEQENKLRILERKKKQMGGGVALFIALFVGSIIFFNTVEEKNEHIEKQETTIGEQREVNNALTEDNKALQEQKTELQSRNRDLAVKQDSTSQELENLRLHYERLKKDYSALKQENDSYITEISSLTSKNSTLERNLKKIESDLASKNSAYRTLQSKYDRVTSDLRVMENKYYATKEGKKELRSN